jgi:glycerol-3-phosphate dehydrogenase
VGNHDALTLLSPMDGRVMFVLPAGAFAIVGTTDTFTTASPDDVRATADDVSYLLATANQFFPAANLTTDDVVAAWAGIRPLLPSAGDTPGAASREHAVAVSGAGLVSISGGKLTTYRVMATDVLRVVCHALGRPLAKPDPGRSPLPGGDIASYDALLAEISRETNDAPLAAHLARSYGGRWRPVWGEISSNGGDAILTEGLPYTAGELRYCARSEMACTLGDLLIRRTKLAFETRDHGTSVAHRAAAAVAGVLSWDERARSASVAAYASEVQRIFSIDA